MGLRIPSRRLAALAAFLAIASSLWAASQWWEKSLAKTLGNPAISPTGCYRLETFKPFWVLPSIFHPLPDPNEGWSPRWFRTWDYPGFYRLYDNRTNTVVGESDIYDLEFVGGGLFWDEGSGRVSAGLITIAPKVYGCISDHPSYSEDRK